MSERVIKRVSDSVTEQVQIVKYSDANSTRRLFGGQLMQWVDIVAGVVGRRHSGREVTTAAIDNLSFLAPVFLGDTVLLKGCITGVGRSSMRVCVDTYKESRSMERTLVNRAHLVMVALDDEGRPCEVPGLEPGAGDCCASEAQGPAT